MARIATDLSKEFNPAPKPQHKRGKPTAKQRGGISAAVTRELYKRSGRICERCYQSRGHERAHSIRRWKVEVRTTVEDLVHLCKLCHIHCDNTKEGRLFLKQFRYSMYRNAGRLHEYYE